MDKKDSLPASCLVCGRQPCDACAVGRKVRPVHGAIVPGDIIVSSIVTAMKPHGGAKSASIRPGPRERCGCRRLRSARSRESINWRRNAEAVVPGIGTGGALFQSEEVGWCSEAAKDKARRMRYDLCALLALLGGEDACFSDC
jgi:hypothetical protein